MKLEPYDPSMIQPSSIDIRLDRYFRVFENHRYPHIDPAIDQPDLTRLVEPEGDEPFILHPGEFALASTYEVITLPDDVAARVEGKSSIGRLGLLTHATAGFIDPGFSGHVTLELSNVATLPIKLWPGMKIGQLCMFQLSSPSEFPYGSEKYGSRYQGQRGPTPSKSHLNFHRTPIDPGLIQAAEAPVQAGREGRPCDGSTSVVPGLRPPSSRLAAVITPPAQGKERHGGRQRAGAPSVKTCVGRELRPDIEGMRAVAVRAFCLPRGPPLRPRRLRRRRRLLRHLRLPDHRPAAAEVASTGGCRSRVLRQPHQAAAAASAWCSCVTRSRQLLRALPSRRSVPGVNISSARCTRPTGISPQAIDDFATGVATRAPSCTSVAAIEEQFYVVWPTLLLAATWLWRRRGQARSAPPPRSWGTLAIVSWPARSRSASTSPTSSPRPPTFSSLPSAAPWSWRSGRRWRRWARCASPRVAAAGIGWAGLGAIVYSAVAFNSSTPPSRNRCCSPTLGTAAVLAAGLPRSSTDRAGRTAGGRRPLRGAARGRSGPGPDARHRSRVLLVVLVALAAARADSGRPRRRADPDAGRPDRAAGGDPSRSLPTATSRSRSGTPRCWSPSRVARSGSPLC